MTNARPALAAARITSSMEPVPSERLVWTWMTPRAPGTTPGGGAGSGSGPAGIMIASAIAATARTAKRRIRRNTGARSRPGMKTVVHRPHPLLQHVGVNLRRREIGVAEHHLDGAEVGAALEQVRRERMPQHVRAERRGDAGAAPVRLQDLPEADARQPRPAAPRVHEEPRTRALAEQRRPAVAQVAPDPRRRLVAHRHDSLLGALARARQLRRLEVHVRLPQP